MRGPLEGVKVLDFSTYLPGPFCTAILTDLGATTIKVERVIPRGACVSWGPDEVRRAYNSRERGKRSIALDLKSQAGKEIYLKLAAKSDVVVAEGRPKMPERLGLGYEDIERINPTVIYCHISGYGYGGPYEQVPGFDNNYVAVGGVLGHIGYGPGGIHVPTWESIAIGDMCGGGLQGAVAIIGALYAREKTGKGQFIDTACAAGTAYIQGMNNGPDWFSRRRKTRRGSILPMVFQCKDGKYINFAINGPYWEKLCRVVGLEQYISDRDIVNARYLDDDFPDTVAARRKQSEIVGMMTGIFLGKTRDEWLPILMKADTCVSPVNEIDEVFTDPQMLSRGMLLELDHPVLGKMKQVGIPFKMSETQPEVRSLAPLPGQHTEEILCELGYSRGCIERMTEAGIIQIVTETQA